MKIQDETFRELIMQAVDRLAPYFDLSAKDIKKCKEFKIRRELGGGIYKNYSQKSPAYAPLDNFFFFPKIQHFRKRIKLMDPEYDFENLLANESKPTINHETGHKIHYYLNPPLKQGILKFIKTGIRPAHHKTFCEMVAEYSNAVDGTFEKRPTWDYYAPVSKIYSKYGPDFLKTLARMPLEEAIRMKLFE